MNDGHKIIETLGNSGLFLDYERSFSLATGLPLALRPIEAWQLVHQQNRRQSPFCGLMARSSRSCAACLQVQQRLSDTARQGPQTVGCFAGLVDSAVPLHIGDRLIGFLQTGQVFRQKPTPQSFARTTRQLSEWDLKVDLQQLEEAYFATRVIDPKQYESMVRMLGIFSQHLGMVSNQLLVQQETSEPAAITRAKEFIQNHQSEDISLGDVARAVNTSTFYFCKMFKKTTGLNFTDYLSRVRIEKAKNLLLNQNLRISEIAFEVGFQSLTHFNRVFKKIVGQSPTHYRLQLPTA